MRRVRMCTSDTSRDVSQLYMVVHPHKWLTTIKDGGTNSIVTYEYDAAGAAHETDVGEQHLLRL